MTIKHTITDDGQHRVEVDSPRLAGDCLMIVFTEEGMVIDSVTGGVVNGTASEMYDEIEDRLQ